MGSISVDVNAGRASAGSRRTRRGIHLLLVGPDGSGKSTLAQRLIAETGGDFTETLHIHWRPTLLPRAGSLVGVAPGDPTDPHAREPRGRFLSPLLLVYHWVDFLFGSWVRILPVRRRGGLIVVERGWPDIAVDPRRYRLSVPPILIAVMGRLLPAPDLVLILRADPEILRGRKAELPVAELARQLRAWERMRFPRKTKRSFLDAARDEQGLLAEAVEALRSL